MHIDDEDGPARDAPKKGSDARRLLGPGPFSTGEWRVVKLASETARAMMEGREAKFATRPEAMRRRIVMGGKSMWIPMLAALLTAAPARGQLAADVPRMAGPHAPSGLGVYWLKSGALPEGAGGGGVLVTYSPTALQGMVTMRGGGGHGVGESPAGFVGVDLRVPMVHQSAGHLMDVAWTTGLGASMGEYMLASMPMGLTAGTRWTTGTIVFSPHFGLGMVMDMRIGEEAPEKEFVVGPAAEVGADLSLDPAQMLTLRVGASLLKRRAVAVGAIVRMGG